MAVCFQASVSLAFSRTRTPTQRRALYGVGLGRIATPMVATATRANDSIVISEPGQDRSSASTPGSSSSAPTVATSASRNAAAAPSGA